MIDQIGVKGSNRFTYNLAPPNKDALVPSVRPVTYIKRYDVMAALLGDQVLPIDILTPETKAQLGIRGYTKQLVLSYLQHKLAIH
ncbi:unnamed protein product [Rotaria sp. Silwood1]|nr:unnamed protein product [Rotaria sp. Silwood1]